MGGTRLKFAAIYGSFSDNTTQEFPVGSGEDAIPIPTPVKFNTTSVMEGLIHDDTAGLNPVITVIHKGIYIVSVEPQIGRQSGANIEDFDMFFQKSTDDGVTFVAIPNSNIKTTIANPNEKVVVSLTGTCDLNAGDQIRIMVAVEDEELILEAFPEDVPNGIPATPSAIMSIQRLAD